MEWLTPMAAIYAGAGAVPLLVLMYFLKLKRREQMVSSTLLWKRAVQDLQVNAPLQRLRRNLLLLLQLLAILAVLAALGRPILSLRAGAGQRYVILIDNSASMNATDLEPSRLAQAREQAKLLVDSLRTRTAFSLGGGSDQAMVIAFNDHAQVMSNYTSDKRQLEAAIDAITPGDGGSSLAEAVTVARAFAQSPGTEANDRSAEEMPHLELFSDGRIRDEEQLVIDPEEIHFHCIGASEDNISLVAMQARRSYENVNEVTVLGTLANYGAEQRNCQVQLSLNGNVRAVREVSIPGHRMVQIDEPGLVLEAKVAGSASVTFVLEHTESGVIELRQLQSDHLRSDDAAWSILPAARQLSVLLVTTGNIALESALEACPLARLDQITPEEFKSWENMADTTIAGMIEEQLYDVIVLDKHSGDDLPRGQYIVFGEPPPDLGVTVEEELENQMIVDWRSQHPLLQYVNLTNFFTAKCYKLNLPRDAEVLGEFNDTAALALLHRKGSTFVLAGFDVMNSNWPFEPGFVMFFYNATRYLSLEADSGEYHTLKVGEAIVLEGGDAETEAQVEGPVFSQDQVVTGELARVNADSAGTVRYAGADRVGVYSVSLADRPREFFAVNLLDTEESNLAPVKELYFSGQQVEAEAGPLRQSNVELWPFLVLLALVMTIVEWLVYNSRVRL